MASAPGIPCSAADAPSAVLIRPDGYVAWVGDGTDRGLHDALATWVGPHVNTSAPARETSGA